MVQIKPADADRLLAKPDPAVRIVLIYGPDEGLVAERAERFAKAVTGTDGEHFRLDPAMLSDNPGRLTDEANAIPMFGGRRAISVRISGNRAMDGAIKAILDAPPVDSWIVVTAGELRKSSPLRKLAESSRGAWAVACYADADRDLDRIIDEEMKLNGMSIGANARAALKNLIGSDRMISRSEVQKLCLFAADKGAIAIEDVQALVGDAGTFAVDETIDSIALGDAAALDRGYRRLLASGTPGFVTAGAALRHFNFLEKARAAYDAGDAAESIVRRAVPPIFFSRQATVARALEMWPAARIARALVILDAAMVDSRLHGNLADDVIGQALQLVATLAAAARRRQA